MSRRRHDTAGAFDALLRAVAALGAALTRTGLPPATTPESFARALGQGVLEGRLARTAQRKRPADAPPLPFEEMRHEGQRSLAELGTRLWHALGGAREAPELEPWMVQAHADPIVALSLSRQRLAEYASPEAIDRCTAFPGPRVWVIEIERAKGDVPGGIAVWRSPGPDGEWRTRCACVWTHGRVGTVTHPLVIGAQWDVHGDNAMAGACVIGPSWDDATRAAGGGTRAKALERRRNAIGKQVIARIVIPAVLAWLDQHGGAARPAGRFGGGETSTTSDRAGHGLPGRFVVPVPGVARTPPPPWLTAGVERAVEAIVIGAAREGYRAGASCPVPEWRRGWAGYAEMGAVAWHAVPDPHAQIDSERWSALERALRYGDLPARSAHPALAATSALVRKMLTQTGRSRVACATDSRTLCALEIPTRLWRALGEAGPPPEGVPEPDLSERWWLVEVEGPGEDEPNAVALWEEDGAQRVLSAFLCADADADPPFVTVVTWRTTTDGERSRAGLAALRCPVHADDPDSAESRAGLKQVVEALAAPDTGPVARAKAAIALHLANDGRVAPLADYRPSRGSASGRDGETPAGGAPMPALFALERAPEPEPGEPHSTGEGESWGGSGGLRARHHVRAHWKRQAFGPQHSRRRLIVVEGYARGPIPNDDQIVMTRMAEGQRRGGSSTRAKRRRARRGRGRRSGGGTAPECP